MLNLRNKIFYTIKPLIPRTIQIYLRRSIIRRKRGLYTDVWPIDKKAGRPPEDWHGWPDKKQFALVLMHDVETEKGQKNCYNLISMEKQLGFCSSFNLVPERYKVSPELRQYLKKSGFDVGVHGLRHDGKYYISRKIFQERTVRINHYLKEWDSVGFSSPSMLRDLEWLHDLNIEYDVSTFDTDPFEPQHDGVGSIFPFRVPHPSNNKGYVELPYTLPQDFTLFIIMREKTIDIWKQKLDWIAEKGGMALLITHPDYMNFEGTNLGDEEYPVEYYIELLEYIKTKYKGQYWSALPREMAHFWIKETVENGHGVYNKNKRIWIDLDNSPHVPFFKPIIEKLTKTGYSVLLTARDCSQTCRLADLAGLHYKRIGRHHGKNKFIKLCGLLYRAFQLIPTVVKDKPSLALSHGSRAQLITAKLLGMSTIIISDYEYARSLPLIYPDWEIVPEVITHSKTKKDKCHILKYPGIKEDVYVPNFKPNPNIKEHLGLHENDLIVTIRPPATDAHYFVSQSEELFEAVMDFLIHEQNARLVLLPRNEKQSELIRKTYQEWIVNEKIVIPNDVIDGLNLIWFSDLVISGGGTMNREASALGVPVYSIFRGKIGDVDRYLSESGRLILIECIDDIKKKIPLKKRHISQYLDKVNENALNSIVGYIKKIADEAYEKSRD
jgi:predicted glycosyltransferase